MHLFTRVNITGSYSTAVEGQEDSYEGEYCCGMRHGVGKYTFSNPDAKGAYYKGTFQGHDRPAPVVEDGAEAPAFVPYHGGLPQGEGVFVYPDGSHYSGM
jgi:hypothetical protein